MDRRTLKFIGYVIIFIIPTVIFLFLYIDKTKNIDSPKSIAPPESRIPISSRKLESNLYGLPFDYFNFKDYHKATMDHYKTLAVSFQDSNELDSAFHYYDKVIKKATHYGDSSRILAQLEIKKSKQKVVKAGNRFAIYTGLFIIILILLLYFLIKGKRARQVSFQSAKQKIIQMKRLQREKELETFVQLLEDKNNIVQEIRKELTILKDHPKNSTAHSSEIHYLIEQLFTARELTSEDWNNFCQLFERVHPDKIRTLRRNTPRITPAEERIYALSVLNKNTIQMANILGISPESVRKTRNSLHKKNSRLTFVH